MARSLVTGATGFVGANLARRLVAEGDEVHLLVRDGHRDWRVRDIRGDVQHHVAALTDQGGLTALLRSVAPERVFHLAAHGAYSTQRDFDAIVATNILGTHNLLRAAIATGVACFVHAGSSSEYGLKDHPPREDEAVAPNSTYAVAKVAASHLVALAAAESELRAMTLRLYSVYGPWEEPTRLIPTLLVRGLDGGYPPLVSPDTARDFIHVEDVCDAFLRAVAAGRAGGIYNIGSGRQTTLREAVAVQRELFGIEQEPAWGQMPARRWDTTTWVAAPELARAELGWQARTGLRDGLSRTLEWLVGDADRIARYRTAILEAQAT